MRTVFQLVLAPVIVVGAVTAGSSRIEYTAAVAPLIGSVSSILPAQGSVVGVAHPVVVTFSSPVALRDRGAAERAVQVTSAPAMTGHFEWLESNVVQWVPDHYWPAHSTVKLTVGELDDEFETGAAVVGVANITDHTFTVTVDGVGEGPPIPLPAPHHMPHAGEDGVLPATMGRPEYPTPVGSYTVLSKDRSLQMDSSSVGIPVDAPDGYLLDVDYAVRITRHGLFVHSAPWAVPAMGYENVSHGCVGLVPAAAEWYFDTVQVGDPVIIQE